MIPDASIIIMASGAASSARRASSGGAVNTAVTAPDPRSLRYSRLSMLHTARLQVKTRGNIGIFADADTSRVRANSTFLHDRSPVRPPGTSSFELQALLGAAVAAVILIDSHGRVEVFNHAAEHLFGYRAAEVTGRNVKMLMTDGDRDTHDAYLERYARTGEARILGIGREVRGRRKDGSEFSALLSVGRIAKAMPPRYVGFLQDLTLRDQALAAVVRERDRARRYLEAVQAILLALSTDGRITLINRKGCEVLGRQESDLIGLNW